MKVKPYHSRVLIAWLAGAVLAVGLMALVGANPAKAADRTFATAPKSPFQVGSSPGSVTNADFDGDGNVDLATSNFDSNNVSVLLGDGGGGFQAATKGPFTVGTHPTSVISADFNDDSFADLAVANRGSNNVWVLLGKGDGDFQAATNSPLAVGVEPTSVIAGHFNADSFVDLAVSNNGSGSVSVLLGQDLNGDGKGDGTFKPQTEYPIYTRTCNDVACISDTGGPNQVIVADFNGDAKADLATANFGICFFGLCAPGGVSVLFGNGNGTFQDYKLATSGTPITSIDANSSGKIVATKYNDDVVSVLSYNGNGNFFVAGTFPVGDGPWSVNSADLNGDSVEDLAVANFHSDNVSVLWGSGSSFQGAQNFPAGDGPDFVIGANFNDDGEVDFADLAVANYTSNNVSVLLNTTRPDTIAPITTRSLSPQPNAAGWNKEDGTVTLNATDDGSGVKEISYSIDGGAPTTVQQSSVQIPVTNEGTTTISYRSTDKANNAEPQQTFAVKIDKTKPTVSSVTAVTGTAPNFTGATNYTAGDLTNKDVRVSWTCADNTGGSGPVNASESRTFTSSGSVTPLCTDQAGNTASGSAFAVKIDKTKPKVSTATPTGTGVARNTNATAAFSEKMVPTTITTSTFKLFRCSSTTSTNCATQITNVDVSLSPDRLTATLNPYPTSSTTLLASRTKFKVVVTTGAKDEAGNPLDQNATTGNQKKVWYFTTRT